MSQLNDYAMNKCGEENIEEIIETETKTKYQFHLFKILFYPQFLTLHLLSAC